MKFKQKIAVLMITAAIQLPCVGYAAEEDRELALIAAEQEGEDARLGEINPALTDSISTKPTQETDKDIKERKKKLKQTRKEKEKENERKLKESTEKNRRDKRDTRDTRREETIIIDEPKDVKPTDLPTPTDTRKVNSSTSTDTRKNNSSTPTDTRKVNSSTPTDTRKNNSSTSTDTRKNNSSMPVDTRKVNSSTPTDTRKNNSSTSTDTRKNNSSTPVDTRKVNSSTPTDTRKNNSSTPVDTPQDIDILDYSNPKSVYANFSEASRAVNFIPLYMPRKSGYEITAIHARQGIVEIRYGRRWEPTVSLTVRTYHRPDGEELRDISGVTGVKWRVDTSTGTSIYLAKVSDSQHVAAWAVGHFTFSALGENLSFAAFHTLVADELVELSTHYYIDL